MNKKVIYSIVGVVIAVELVVEGVLLVNGNKNNTESIDPESENTVDLETQSGETESETTDLENSQVQEFSDDEL